MRKFIFLFSVLCLLYACSSDDETIGNKETQIELVASENGFSINSEGGVLEFELKSNVSWKASTDQKWCQVSPSEGEAGTTTLRVSFSENESYDERNATLMVEGGEISQMLTVTQKQKDALTVTSGKVELGDGEESFDVEVRSNVSFEYEIDEKCRSWLKEVKNDTRSLSATMLHFKAEANEEIERREGKIMIRSGELSEVISVYQEGKEPTLVLTQSEYVVSSDGETICVELSSNVPYEIQMPEEGWITENKTRALSTYTHYFTISSNDGYDSRETEISFINKTNNLVEKVYITQMQKDAIIVAKNEYEITSAGEILEFVVSTNVNLQISSSVDWIKEVVKTRGLEDKLLRFEVAANPDNKVREGFIKISNGELEQVVKVIQDPYYFIHLDKTKCGVECLGNTIVLEVDANVDYEINTSANWIRIDRQKGTPDIVTLQIAPLSYVVGNDLGRNAEVFFADSEQKVVEILTINQYPHDMVIPASSLGYGGKICYDTLFIGYKKGYEQRRECYLGEAPVIKEVTVDWLDVSYEPLTRNFVVKVIKENPLEQSRSGFINVEQGEYKQRIEVLQASRPTKVGEYYAMDLGLSVKWAIHNVGATSETGKGGLYGWADPTGLETTDKVYTRKEDGHLYWTSPLYGGPNPPESICGTQLDIATVKWGNGWRLPSYDEILELNSYCSENGWDSRGTNWITKDGVEGVELESYNGNRIFLPAGGIRYGENIDEKNINGYLAAYYWTGTLFGGDDACRFNYDASMNVDGDHLVDNAFFACRYIGYSVRPVAE